MAKVVKRARRGITPGEGSITALVRTCYYTSKHIMRPTAHLVVTTII